MHLQLRSSRAGKSDGTRNSSSATLKLTENDAPIVVALDFQGEKFSYVPVGGVLDFDYIVTDFLIAIISGSRLFPKIERRLNKLEKKLEDVCGLGFRDAL